MTLRASTLPSSSILKSGLASCAIWGSRRTSSSSIPMTGCGGYARMDEATDFRYLRYLIARLAAYRNVWWSLANEYDFLLDNKPMAQWDQFFQILLKDDPYNHLRSIYQGNPEHMYDHTKPGITHVCIQHSTYGGSLIGGRNIANLSSMTSWNTKGIFLTLGRHQRRGRGASLLADGDERWLRRTWRNVSASERYIVVVERRCASR